MFTHLKFICSCSDENRKESIELLRTDEVTKAVENDEVDATLAAKTNNVVLEEIRDGQYYLKVLIYSCISC